MFLTHTEWLKKSNYPLWWNEFSLRLQLSPLLLSVFHSFFFFFGPLSFFLFPSTPAPGLENSQELRKCPTAESKLIVNILACPCELRQGFMFFSLLYYESVKVYVYGGYKQVTNPHSQYTWHVCRYALDASTVILFCVPPTRPTYVHTQARIHSMRAQGRLAFSRPPPENGGWWKIQLSQSVA